MGGFFEWKGDIIEISATCATCGKRIVGTMKGELLAFREEPCEHFRKLWDKAKLAAFFEVTKRFSEVESEER